MNQKVAATSQNLPFGIFLLIKSVKMALASPEAVKSKILGNAIFVTKSDTLPASVETMLVKSNSFLKLVDADKKLVALELDKMRRPNYDLSQSLMDLVIKNWVNKTIFEKSRAEEFKTNVKKTNAKTNKNMAKNNSNQYSQPLKSSKPVKVLHSVNAKSFSSQDNSDGQKVKAAPIITIKKTLQLKKS